MSTKTVSRKRILRHEKAFEFKFDEDDVRRVSEKLQEPDWLLERRLKAWRIYTSLPMPSTRDEPWRRTDIRALPDVTLDVQTDIEPPELLQQPLLGEEHGALLVLRPGHDTPILEHSQNFPEGVIFTDWTTAVRDHEAVMKPHLGSVVSADDGKFAALAEALTEEGVLVYVPKGVQLEQPLHSVLWSSAIGKATMDRILIVVEDGASATYLHENASSTEEGEAVHVGIVEIILGKNSSLKFVEIQNLGQHVWNFSHERAHIGKDARLDWIFGAVGSHLTKTFSDMYMMGEGSQGRMSGFYIADKDQHLDHDTQQNHMAANTTSDLLFKGALLDQSRSVWQGMIYVAPGAQKTDGYQANRNLILSKEARADSIPGLEILADDVRCTHGATVGQLEEEPIFYLMSRGLPRAEAERLVIDGFFSPIMERVPFEGVRNRFKDMIDRKLGA
jgi:Fe-S cluster assembly protein SufD